MFRFIFIALISLAALGSSAHDLNLPDLGGAGGGLISASQEYELGQEWQRVYRSQIPTSNDPFLQSYTEDLIQHLAKFSDLKDKRLDVLIIENPQLNAFAVPGGVIGVNTGLFEYAATEQQFSSVIAHELAHISQRHYARQLDEQNNNQIPNIATLLASILVLATAGGDAGIAAISASQAAMIDSKLRFSRKLEREADRVGMETMVRAGMDPYAMPDMFEAMLHSSRFRSRPPEFLITHPLTETRISDSKLRAQQYPAKQIAQSQHYQLVKTRAEIINENKLLTRLKHYDEELKRNTLNPEIARYGLALSQHRLGRLKEATNNFERLRSSAPNNLFFDVGLAEVLADQENFTASLDILNPLHATSPDNHILNVKLAEILMKAGEYKRCEALLEAHVERRPKDDYVWYLLAEAHGLTGDIYQVHLARTEYYLLNGIYKKAENHIRHAMRMLEPDDKKRARLEIKLKDIQKMQRDSTFG